MADQVIRVATERLSAMYGKMTAVKDVTLAFDANRVHAPGPEALEDHHVAGADLDHGLALVVHDVQAATVRGEHDGSRVPASAGAVNHALSGDVDLHDTAALVEREVEVPARLVDDHVARFAG